MKLLGISTRWIARAGTWKLPSSIKRWGQLSGVKTLSNGLAMELQKTHLLVGRVWAPVGVESRSK